MEKITVVSVDDHLLINQAIKNALEPHEGVEVVAQGSVGDDVLALVDKYQPTVLILDISMPQSRHASSKGQFQALPTIARLQKSYPETRIIILTQFFAPGIIHGAIDLGVKGVILKSDALSLNIPQAVLMVSQGSVAFSETVSQEIFGRNGQERNPLTKRHLDILSVIATDPGAPYAVHAKSLGISESTLKNHLTKIFSILGVPNITSALLQAMKLGLITIDGPTGA